MKSAFKALVAALVMALAFAPSVAAGPLEDAEAAFSRRDFVSALRLYRPLADKGVAAAQFRLAMMYGAGDALYMGVPSDTAEAVKWLRKAADQGETWGQYNLGLIYEEGRDVPQDFVTAHMWYNLAAAQGGEGAAEKRERLSKLMTPAQIAEAQKLAREWKPTKPK